MLAAEVASQREDILLLLVQLEDLADAFGSAQERYSSPSPLPSVRHYEWKGSRNPSKQ